MIKKIKAYILLKLGIITIRQRLDYLSAFLNVTYPERLGLDTEILETAINRVKEESLIKDFNPAIHKNDLMFAFHVYHHSYNLYEAVSSYFDIGVKTALNLKAIADRYNLKCETVLDFGSGYGRVSRFLPQVLTDSQIVITEVKERALLFQEETFGFKGILPGQDPSSFPEEKFDLIFCLSVFTHLPKESFKTWFQKILQSINPGGAVIITYNEIKGSQADFKFLRQSEDMMFSFVADSITSTEVYGETHVSRKFLANQIPVNGAHYHFLERSLVAGQDALLVVKA